MTAADDHLGGSIWFAALVLGVVLGGIAWRTKIKPWLKHRRDMENVREVLRLAYKDPASAPIALPWSSTAHEPVSIPLTGWQPTRLYRRGSAISYGSHDFQVRMHAHIHDTPALTRLQDMGRALDQIYPAIPNERTT